MTHYSYSNRDALAAILFFCLHIFLALHLLSAECGFPSYYFGTAQVLQKCSIPD